MTAVNVLMISHLFPRPGRPGIATFIRRQVAELMSRGVQVTVISPVPWLPEWMSRAVARDVETSEAVPARWDDDGCEVFAPRFPKLPGRIDHGLFGPLCYLGIRGTALRLHRERRFDLVHGQMLIPDGFAAARLGAELGIPSIATERGYLSVMAGGSAGQRAAIRWTLRHVGQSVFVSRALQELACSMATPLRPPRVIYTGLDKQDFTRVPKQHARAQLALSNADQLIVHVGRNDPRKGVEELLSAFIAIADKFPKAKLCLVGAGSLDRALRDRAATAGAAERIRITGVRPHKEIPLWLSAADLVVHPSRRQSEGLPNALVEAAACECPIVATRVSGIPELIEHDVSGVLVDPENVPALTAAMSRLLADPAEATRLAQCAQETVRNRFSWSTHRDQMLSLYEALLRGASQ